MKLYLRTHKAMHKNCPPLILMIQQYPFIIKPKPMHALRPFNFDKLTFGFGVTIT